jgi:short-subunit dehydrogenase
METCRSVFDDALLTEQDDGVAQNAVTIAGSQVVLTGASGGLGGAIARGLDDRGACLMLTGRRVDALDALAAGLKDAQVLQCDLADRDQLAAILAQVEDADILVANAALPATGTLDDFTTEELDRALDVNLRAPMLLAKHLAPRMAARGRGHLVFIASMGAKAPASRLSIYAATKYGLRGFAACLRQEFAANGVAVSAVFPGSVEDVGMWAESGASGKVGTVSSSAVADGVIRAIERNRAEVDVAPWSVRVAAALAHLLPGTYARLARRSGADEQTAALAAGLRHKR